MKQIIKLLDQILKKIILTFIRIYQKTISPDKGILSLFLKGKVCGHTPHCSEYSKQVFKRYNFFQAMEYSINRIVSCRGQKRYDPYFYKIVFFSSAEIGIPFFQELDKDKRFEIVGIVSTPAKPAGRGMKIQDNGFVKGIKKLAEKGDISLSGKNLEKILQTPEKIKNNSEFKERLKSLDADFFVVISYGKILPKEILEIPKFGPINIHGSLLPKYRGASPIQSVFLNNEKESGITIMEMNEKMDEGDIISKLKIKIPFEWTAKELIQRMKQKGPKFLNNVLRDFGKGELDKQKQDENQALYCKKIIKSDGEINPFTDSLSEIYNKYRAFIFWPKIFFEFKNKHFIIEFLELDHNIFLKTKTQPLFIVSNGHLELNQAVKNIKIKAQGKKAIDFQAFKNGYFR